MTVRWRKVPLGDVCTVTMGQAPVGESYNDRSFGLPLVAGAGDLSEDGIHPKKYTSKPTRVCRPGDIVLGIRATIGVRAWADGEYCLGRGVAGLRPGPDLDANFLWHWLGAVRGELERKGRGATFLQVNRADITNLDVPLPPLVEQRRIARALDLARRIQVQRREALALIDLLPEALFTSLFVDNRNAQESAAIASLAAERKDAIRTGPFGSQLLHEEFTDTGIAVLGIDNAVQNRFAWGKRRFISEEKYAQLRRYTVHPGDVLVTIMGTCGRVAVVPDDIPTAINTKHLCCISLDRDRCLPEFLWACLRFHPAVRRQLGATQGAVMPGLNMGIIKRTEVPLPQIRMQARFVEKLAALRRHAETTVESARRIETLFNALQQRAFRGEL